MSERPTGKSSEFINMDVTTMGKLRTVTSAATTAGQRLIARFMKDGTSTPYLAAIGKRFGRSSITQNQVVQLARENPMSTALILWELGDVGYETLQAMKAEDAEIAAVVDALGFKPDSISETKGVMDIAKFADEFAVIDEASYVVGGVSQLLALKKALSIPTEVYALREQVREMS